MGDGDFTMILTHTRRSKLPDGRYFIEVYDEEIDDAIFAASQAADAQAAQEIQDQAVEEDSNASNDNQQPDRN